jgi:hypothetical protein
MTDYNLIPLGDHCAISEILRELELRKCSYPFDWVAKPGLIYNTNLPDNFDFVLELMETHNVKEIVQKFIGDALDSPNHSSGEKWFPHESGTKEEIVAKYERRFERLYTAIKEEKNIFIILIRHIVLPESYFNLILSRILAFNPQNRILFISGSDHPYLYAPHYRASVRFKHILYDLEKLDKDFTQDYKVFRPAIREYMRELFRDMGYKVPDAP